MDQGVPVGLQRADRFAVLSTWDVLHHRIDARGFGAYEPLKERIGAPTPILGREDVDSAVREAAPGKDAAVEWRREDFLELDREHDLSADFYWHLFSRHPTMVVLFWRFNLFQSLEKIVSVVGNCDEHQLAEQFASLAARHKGRGIRSVDYDTIGESVQFALAKALTDRDVRAWMRAWNMFSAALKSDGNDAAAEVVDVESLRTVTLEELHNHKSSDSAWILIDGVVRDVTEFIRVHPGGELILNGIGKDASKMFASLHSKFARQQLLRLPVVGRMLQVQEK
jgi:cytochrome b involved in lipid metabolism